MKKIPTLFKREFENHRVVNIHPEVTEGFEWVLNGEEVIPRVSVELEEPEAEPEQPRDFWEAFRYCSER